MFTTHSICSIHKLKSLNTEQLVKILSFKITGSPSLTSVFSLTVRLLSAMRMKIVLFQSIWRSYQAIGLDPMPKIHHKTVLCMACSIVQMFISSTAFLIFQPNTKTVQELTTSFYTSISELFVLVIFASLVPKIGDMKKLTVAFERFIEQSESKYVNGCVFR